MFSPKIEVASGSFATHLLAELRLALDFLFDLVYLNDSSTITGDNSRHDSFQLIH